MAWGAQIYKIVGNIEKVNRATTHWILNEIIGQMFKMKEGIFPYLLDYSSH